MRNLKFHFYLDKSVKSGASANAERRILSKGVGVSKIEQNDNSVFSSTFRHKHIAFTPTLRAQNKYERWTGDQGCDHRAAVPKYSSVRKRDKKTLTANNKKGSMPRLNSQKITSNLIRNLNCNYFYGIKTPPTLRPNVGN